MITLGLILHFSESSFGLIAGSDSILNFGATTGVASGPNSSFGASSNVASVTATPYSNTLSSGNNAISGVTGDSGFFNPGSNFGSGKTNGYGSNAGFYGTGPVSGVTSGTTSFGASINFRASQAICLDSSGVTKPGASYGQSPEPYSGTNVKNNVVGLNNGVRSAGTSNNYGSSTGPGIIGARTNFNGYNNTIPY
ncbi:hypothetical protein K502DRAFT_346193 [Neoconidiobolus thromboides FSU 785]|nr:hypothetical protein K502DRAFT_346193 [Neoconidiobolus thromboides FSU 785]